MYYVRLCVSWIFGGALFALFFRQIVLTSPAHSHLSLSSPWEWNRRGTYFSFFRTDVELILRASQRGGVGRGRPQSPCFFKPTV